MNKAKNFSEFYKILKMKALPGYNVGYADKNDTIFYMSNGIIPKREKGYNWAHVVPGNTRKHYGLKIMTLKTCRKYYSRNQAIFIMLTILHFVLRDQMITQTLKSLMKIWVLKNSITTDLQE